MFCRDGDTGSLREHSLSTSLDFGSPKGGHEAPNLLVWCHFGKPKRERKALFFLKAPRKVPGRDFVEIWNGFGRYFECISESVFNDCLVVL